MRFFLDQNVDAECGRVLRSAGHDCWTAEEAGLPADSDGDLAIYAHNKNAVLVTHDKGFTGWRSRNTIGQHIQLDCTEPDGPDVLEAWLSLVLDVLEHRENIVISVRRNGYTVREGWE